MSSQGSNANLNGKSYEYITNKLLFTRIQKNYTLKEVKKDNDGCFVYCEIWKNNKLICIYSAQSNFNTIFLKNHQIDSKTIIKKEKRPDGCFYFVNTNTVIILELKNQSRGGSVDEKPGGCQLLVDIYEQILSKLNCKIKLFYILDEWFNNDSFYTTENFLIKHNIGYHFGIKDFTLDLIGLEEIVKTSDIEIDQIIKECDSEFNERQEIKKQNNKKKKEKNEKYINKFFDGGEPLF